MRNVFLALLIVNLVYFAWSHWLDVPAAPFVNTANARLPSLKLLDEVPLSQRPAPVAAAPPAAACMSVGPFADVDNSAKAAAILRNKGFDPRQRAVAGDMSDGYWVFIGGLKNDGDSDRVLVSLEHGGIKDFLIVPATADTGRRISLGLYTERGRADRRAQAVRDLGLKAEVAARKIPSTIYWVDLAPLPGMNTVPIQDLLAGNVSSHIAVQPCPVTPAAPTPIAPAAAPTSAGPVVPPPTSAPPKLP